MAKEKHKPLFTELPDSNLPQVDLLDSAPVHQQGVDAQTLANDFLGDTVTANILAMGYAWQRGLVPVSLAALLRAIELNGVAVAANVAAFSLGRLAAADPGACEALLGDQVRPAPVAAESIDVVITQGMNHLTAYQNAAWAERYAALVSDNRARRVGDLLTIRLVERTQSRKSASADTKRDSSTDIVLPDIPGFSSIAAGALNGGLTQKFNGGGTAALLFMGDMINKSNTSKTIRGVGSLIGFGTSPAATGSDK